MCEGHESKTAFQNHWWLYEYTVLPFRLANAPTTFYNLEKNILNENSDVFCIVYLNNTLVFSKLLAGYKEHIYWLLSKLHANSLFI